jgi:polyhydroxyalkanoate synthesis regulator phasin
MSELEQLILNQIQIAKREIISEINELKRRVDRLQTELSDLKNKTKKD